MSATRIVLVRHGESVAQVEGFVGGHAACRGLSDTGRRQVAALATRLAAGELGKVRHLYSSTMARAVETAEILAPALAVDPSAPDCDLCELHPGDADGLTWAEVARRWPPTGVPGTGGLIDNAETWEQMHARVGGALLRLAERHEGETVVVACHGGVVAHAMFDRLRIPLDGDASAGDAGPAWLVADNASLTEFVHDHTLDDWRAGRWGLVRYNDTAHLSSIWQPPGHA